MKRNDNEIDYLIDRIDHEFMKGKFVKIEFYDGHWLTIHELQDTRPVEYLLKLDDGRLIFSTYKKLESELRIVLYNFNNKVLDENGYMFLERFKEGE